MSNTSYIDLQSLLAYVFVILFHTWWAGYIHAPMSTNSTMDSRILLIRARWISWSMYCRWHAHWHTINPCCAQNGTCHPPSTGSSLFSRYCAMQFPLVVWLFFWHTHVGHTRTERGLSAYKSYPRTNGDLSLRAAESTRWRRHWPGLYAWSLLCLDKKVSSNWRIHMKSLTAYLYKLKIQQHIPCLTLQESMPWFRI